MNKDLKEKISNCYCELWNTNPDILIKQKVPEGFCGLCETCGKPGHTRSYPAPVAYTGAWCDRCYKILSWTWLFRLPLGWFVLSIVLVLLSLIYSLIFK